jgi:hypothetical protein
VCARRGFLIGETTNALLSSAWMFYMVKAMVQILVLGNNDDTSHRQKPTILCVAVA